MEQINLEINGKFFQVENLGTTLGSGGSGFTRSITVRPLSNNDFITINELVGIMNFPISITEMNITIPSNNINFNEDMTITLFREQNIGDLI